MVQRKRNKIEHIYLANSLQQGFIYHALSQETDDAYRVQQVFDCRQKLHVENYISAWELAIKKYPILRTAFNWEEELIQIIYREASLDYQVKDISDLSEKEREAYITNLQQEDRKQSFDLTKPCLVRLYIVKQKEDHYTILSTKHHSISDGWSGPVLLNTTQRYYEALQEGKKVKIEEDHSYLKAQEYISKEKDRVAHFWEQKVAAVMQSNDLNPLLSHKHDLDNLRSLGEAYDHRIELSGELYKQLKQLTKKDRVGIFQ